MKQPVTVIIAGAGGRGTGYAEYAKHHPDLMKVVGVAEPRDFYRQRLADEYKIPPENVFKDWRDMAARERFADAVLVCTQDAMHEEPAVAFAERKYDMLLEKPMAPTADACRRIVRAAKDNGILFGVCHVLRYTSYTRKLKELIAAGAVGDVVCIEHHEDVAFWHQAHSFVRGNWRNSKESSFMLLAKSCHDMDWMRHVMGKRCLRVSSFGALKHFRKEEQPAGAADRCLDCGIEADCPYSAKRIYTSLLDRGYTEWPLDVVTPVVSRENLTEALRTGPYGRCVYACDNDVVDNQVVSLEFEGGRSASFVMTAFGKGGRKSTVFGTRGQIVGEEDKLWVYDFMTDKTTEIDPHHVGVVGDSGEADVMGGHGGGDYGIMQAFVKAVSEQDASYILSGPDETLETHLMVFAAEKSRLSGTVEAVA